MKEEERRSFLRDVVIGVVGIWGVVFFLSGFRFLNPVDTALRIFSGGSVLVMVAYFHRRSAWLAFNGLVVVSFVSLVGFQIAFHKMCARELEPLRQEFEIVVWEGHWDHDLPTAPPRVVGTVDLIIANKQYTLLEMGGMEIGGWYVNPPEEGRVYPTTNSWYLYTGFLPEDWRRTLLNLPGEEKPSEINPEDRPLHSPPPPQPRRPKPERPTVSPATTLHTQCAGSVFYYC